MRVIPNPFREKLFCALCRGHALGCFAAQLFTSAAPLKELVLTLYHTHTHTHIEVVALTNTAVTAVQLKLLQTHPCAKRSEQKGKNK